MNSAQQNTITTAEAANHLFHSGLKPANISVGVLVQFGPHKGNRHDYFFNLLRVSETEWITSTSFSASYGKNVVSAR